MLKVICGLVTSLRENGWEVSSKRRLRPLWASHHLPGDQPRQEGAYSPRAAPSASPSPRVMTMALGQTPPQVSSPPSLPSPLSEPPPFIKTLSGTWGAWSWVPLQQEPLSLDPRALSGAKSSAIPRAEMSTTSSFQAASRDLILCVFLKQ